MQTVSTRIYVKNLRLYAYHGVLPQERVVGNHYVLNVTISYPFMQAMTTDCVEHTLSYADVCAVLTEVMRAPSHLLEHVAGRMGNALVKAFPEIEELWIDVRKENPPMGVDCDGAGVQLHLINGKT